MSIILASKSAARLSMLRNIGLDFEAISAPINEAKIQNQHGTDDNLSLILARAKSLSLADLYPKALVIGSDQTLSLDGVYIHKADTNAQAIDKLKSLRGKTHRLQSSVVISQAGQVLFEHTDAAFLTMHDFDDDFLNEYAQKAGDHLTQTVGAYAIESHGAWLFERVQGDYYTILGMPLFPLLNFLYRMES